jgi:hypothetical protein
MRLTVKEAQAMRIPMTPQECRDNPMVKGHQKYSNQKIVDADGQKFDSKAEHKYWLHLKLRERAKEIFNLERQVVYVLAPAVAIAGRKRPPLRYIADMRWNEGSKTGPVIVADVKGAVTPEYRIKRHLMASVHGIEIQEIRA